MKRRMGLAALWAIGVGQALAQAPATMRGDGPAPEAAPFSITRADPRLDDIVAADAELVPMADGFGLTEGPVWIPEGESGFLLVGGLLDNVIYKITLQGDVSVYVDYAGYTGDDVNNVGAQTRSGRSHVLLIGPSCASRDPQGRLVWCADNDLAIMRLEEDGTRTTLADNHEGKRFSGPNDLTIASDGSIYFTDNDFGLRGAGASPLKEMPNGVWLVRDGETIRLLDRDQLGGIPNGIALSPDERYLYLSAGRTMKRYEVEPDGTLGDSIVFNEGVGIGDGIKVDRAGNVYSTSGAGPGVVRIMAPDGTFLGSLNLPIYGGEPKKQICATNIAFGGNDGRTLFITACDVVYRIGLLTEGVVPGPRIAGERALLEEARAQLDELRALEDIRTLFVDYGRTLDDRDFAAFGALFAPDAEFVGGGNTGPAQGPEAIAAMLEASLSRNATGANLHIFSNEKIEVSGDQATATSRGAFVGQNDEGRPALLIYATYEDELVRHDGRWKFKRRRIVGDIPGPANAARE